METVLLSSQATVQMYWLKTWIGQCCPFLHKTRWEAAIGHVLSHHGTRLAAQALCIYSQY